MQSIASVRVDSRGWVRARVLRVVGAGIIVLASMVSDSEPSGAYQSYNHGYATGYSWVTPNNVTGVYGVRTDVGVIFTKHWYPCNQATNRSQGGRFISRRGSYSPPMPRTG